MIKNYLLLLSILLFSNNIFSQITVNDGQAIGFSESSGLKAGIVKTSIPLFEFNTGNLSIPAGITYTMEPLKHRSFPGIVGEKWYLDFQYFLTIFFQ